MHSDPPRTLAHQWRDIEHRRCELERVADKTDADVREICRLLELGWELRERMREGEE